MGVLNVTPDSFSDGGELFDGPRLSLGQVIDRCAQMLAEGATLIDVGGESTRPGAAAVSAEEELGRVVPVVEALAERFDCVISVDSSNAQVMQASVAAGAGLINDVRALQRDGALEVAAASGLPVCVMHMQGEPDTMQNNPAYRDVVAEVCEWARQRSAAIIAAGIPAQQIVLDPGFGFGKTLQHNLLLLKNLNTLVALGHPVLVGLSRKSMIGTITGRNVTERATGSAVLAALAVSAGAAIVRAHDIAETSDALKLAVAVKTAAAT